MRQCHAHLSSSSSPLLGRSWRGRKSKPSTRRTDARPAAGCAACAVACAGEEDRRVVGHEVGVATGHLQLLENSRASTAKLLLSTPSRTAHRGIPSSSSSSTGAVVREEEATGVAGRRPGRRFTPQGSRAATGDLNGGCTTGRLEVAKGGGGKRRVVKDGGGRRVCLSEKKGRGREEKRKRIKKIKKCGIH